MTRTIDTNKVTVGCLDLSTRQPLNVTKKLPAWYAAEPAILRAFKLLLPANIKPIDVIRIDKLGKVPYHMPEYLYIQLAADDSEDEETDETENNI